MFDSPADAIAMDAAHVSLDRAMPGDAAAHLARAMGQIRGVIGVQPRATERPSFLVIFAKPVRAGQIAGRLAALRHFTGVLGAKPVALPRQKPFDALVAVSDLREAIIDQLVEQLLTMEPYGDAEADAILFYRVRQSVLGTLRWPRSDL